MFESIVQHGAHDKKTMTVTEEGFDNVLFVTLLLDMHGDTVSLQQVLTREEVRELRDKLTEWLAGEAGPTEGPALKVVR